MATISDITNAASYKGTSELGGGLGIGVTIDTTPLQRLANFTYYRDRDMWEQKERQDKLAADKIASLAAFDITSPFKQYSDDLKYRLDTIRNYVKENPDSLVYSRNPKKYQEREELVADFLNRRKNATSNDALYNGEKAKIQQIVDENERALAEKELKINTNDLFSGGVESSYGKQLQAVSKLKPSDYVIPTPTNIKRAIITPLPNEIGKTELAYTDLDDLDAKSALLVAGASPEDITNEDWFKNLSPEKQQLALDKSTLTGSKRKKLQELSLTFNNYLDQWKAANPTIDLTKIDATNVDSLPDGIIEDNIRAAILINDQIDQLNSYVLEGRIKDPLDRVRKKPYAKIKFTDGLSEVELVKMKAIQGDKNSILQSIDKTVTSTNDANEKRRLSIEEKNAETSRMNAETARTNADKTTSPGLESPDVMDLTGYTGSPSSLSISDMAAINPTFVTSENGVLKLSQEGMDARKTITIDKATGDVTYKENEDQKDPDTGKTKTVLVDRIVPKNIYQKQAVTHVQTILKDRKGETGNPFTNTGKKETVDEDMKLSEGEYYKKYKKPKPKK